MDKDRLLANLDKIHTTDMGYARIMKNLQLEDIDAVLFCKNLVMSKKSSISKKGKNWYIVNGDIKVTINSYSYTIITAHRL